MRALRLESLGISALLLLTSATWAWQANVDGVSNAGGSASAVAVDSQGNVVAAGATINNVGGDQDFTVVKLDQAGAELWRTVIDGSDANSDDGASAVVVDGAGNVVAAGHTQNTGSSSDFTVVKFDGLTGNVVWQKNVDGATHGIDKAVAVTVDRQGNVIAAGVTNNSPTGDDFTVVKFDGLTGTVLWQTLINGTATKDDEAVAVAVDGRDDVIAAGDTVNAGRGADFTVVKLDRTNGSIVWQTDINGSASGDDHARAVAVDGRGNVVAAGITANVGSGADFTVVKLDQRGTEQWRAVIDGTESSADEASAVAVDGRGDVVAAGHTVNTGSLSDFTVIKFRKNGGELWRAVINGTASSIDEAFAVTVDGRGDVVAAGDTVNTGSFTDFTVIKFKKSGGELWRAVINGTVNSIDDAFAVTVDGAGNAVAAGTTWNANRDFTVVKRRGTDGADF